MQEQAGWRAVLPRVVVWMTVITLLLSWVPAQAAAPIQTVPAAGCDAVAPEALRDELNRISQTIFSGDQSLLDIEAIVARQWTLLGMDARLDAEVDQAVIQVRADADLWSQFLSGWSPSQAEALTRRVAEIAFASPGFRSAVDELAAAVAADAAAALAALSAESASLTTLCLQSYIGARYSEAMVAAFTREIQAQTAALEFDVDESSTSGVMAVIGRHRTALGGVGVIIAGQIAKRVVVKLGQTISKRVAGRIVGRVIGKAGSTIIPVAGWAIGSAMILYDLLESRDGALPEIQAGLKTPEVKAALRDEIAVSVESELHLEMPQLARDIANDLYAAWLDFQRKYVQVVALAETNPAFQPILAQAEDMGALATLIDISLTTLGPAGVDTAIADGSLARALELPESAYPILAVSGSFADLFAWADLAGGQLDQVVQLEIYKHQSPGSLTRDRLSALLAVADADAIARLVLLEGEALDRLLNLSTPHVRRLAQTLTADDLTWLAGYLAALRQDQANQLVAQLLDDPALMARLKDEQVQRQIAAGEEIATTLRFLDAPVTLMGFAEDWLRLVTGDVTFGLFRAKYGLFVMVVALGVPLLVILALLQTLLLWLIAPLRTLGRGVRALTRRPSQPGPR